MKKSEQIYLFTKSLVAKEELKNIYKHDYPVFILENIIYRFCSVIRVFKPKEKYMYLESNMDTFNNDVFKVHLTKKVYLFINKQDFINYLLFLEGVFKSEND